MNIKFYFSSFIKESIALDIEPWAKLNAADLKYLKLNHEFLLLNALIFHKELSTHTHT